MKRQKVPKVKKTGFQNHTRISSFGLAKDMVGLQDIEVDSIAIAISTSCQNLQLEESPGFFS